MDTPDSRIVFGTTVQGLFHIALHGRLSPSARAALRDAGLDLDQDLLPAYPLTTWTRCLEITLRELWPDLDKEAAYRLLGHELVAGLTGTMLGRVMTAAARALGPRQGLGQLNRAFRGSDNYLESRVLEMGQHACELWLNDILDRPSYYQGILEATLRTMGAREPRVTLLRMEGRAGVFRLEWAA